MIDAPLQYTSHVRTSPLAVNIKRPHGATKKEAFFRVSKSRHSPSQAESGPHSRLNKMRIYQL